MELIIKPKREIVHYHCYALHVSILHVWLDLNQFIFLVYNDKISIYPHNLS